MEDYRMVLTINYDGVDYVNDSYSRNPSATWYALEATEGPIILIAGGLVNRKHEEPYCNAWNAPLAAKGRCVILIGRDNTAIRESLTVDIPIFEVESLEDAVGWARKKSKKGDTVLFSPGAASFDRFENWQHRGSMFNEIVKLI